MTGFALVLLLAAGLTAWGITEARRLRTLDESAGRAMRQIGAQVASRFDAVAALLELSCDYTARKAPGIEDVRDQRSVLSTADDAETLARQEVLTEEMLGYIRQVRSDYPAFGQDAGYVRAAAALDCCRQMLTVSRARYNEAAGRVNAEQRRFPARLVAGAMGLHCRALLPETATCEKREK